MQQNVLVLYRRQHHRQEGHRQANHQHHQQAQPRGKVLDHMQADKKISIVIPALNEEKGIGPVLQELPLQALRDRGYETEVLVVDNGSTDRTAQIAREYGATVIMQPIRGYGNAYKVGFAKASGDIIATGDADFTYPFAILPEVLAHMEQEDWDFINADRLTQLHKEVMSCSHRIGNAFLTAMLRLLFGWPFHDSQSGMWIFRRAIWHKLHVTASGMPFSQEFKLEAYLQGFKCAEIPILYRARAGKEKLHTIQDGVGNTLHLIQKKCVVSNSVVRSMKWSITSHNG
jgi:glycosyltransferase involved in cell wall biosynthesis